jgi:hypothetical protein
MLMRSFQMTSTLLMYLLENVDQDLNDDSMQMLTMILFSLFYLLFDRSDLKQNFLDIQKNRKIIHSISVS